MSALEDSKTEAAGLFSASIETFIASPQSVRTWRKAGIVEPGERIKPAGDIKTALRNRSLDDSDYQTQIEQAGELSKHSKLLRDLYERGADVKGETLIIPAEEFEVPGEQDHIRVISISHAFGKFRNDPKTAVEFHSLARA